MEVGGLWKRSHSNHSEAALHPAHVKTATHPWRCSTLCIYAARGVYIGYYTARGVSPSGHRPGAVVHYVYTRCVTNGVKRRIFGTSGNTMESLRTGGAGV